MKKLSLMLVFIIISIFIICLFAKNMYDYCNLLDENHRLKGEINCLKNSTNGEIQFIWNDDLEALPADGQNIKIEFTQDNRIYLTNVEN